MLEKGKLNTIEVLIFHHLKNNFLILGEGYTFGINGSLDAPEKSKLKILLESTIMPI